MVSQSDVVRFAKDNQHITKLLENGKLQFVQTGMEFSANTKRSVLEAYAGGRAYRRAIWTRENASYDFAQHEPYIVPHKHRNENKFLFCKLTNCTIPRRKDCVEGHIAGKKFRRRFKEAEDARLEQERLLVKRKERAREARKTGSELEDLGDEAACDIDNVEIGDGSHRGSKEGGREVDVNTMSDFEDEIQELKDYFDKRDRAEKQDMEEEVENVFWTRGPKTGVSKDDDDEIDDKDEWSRPRKSRYATRASGKTAKDLVKSVVVDVDDKDKELSPSSALADGTTVNTGKRTRTTKSPKRVRRPRQRRKSESIQT